MASIAEQLAAAFASQGEQKQTAPSGIRGRLAARFGPKKSITISSRSRGGPVAGAVAGGGGGQSGMLSSLQEQQRAFNREQAKRMKQVQRQAKKTRQRALAKQKKARQKAAGVGKAAIADLERDATRAQAASQQSLISRGLGNTSIVEQQQRAIGEDVGRQRRAITEDVARLQSGLFSQEAGMEAQMGRLGIDTALSRRDQVPNLSHTLSLLSQLGGGV